MIPRGERVDFLHLNYVELMISITIWRGSKEMEPYAFRSMENEALSLLRTSYPEQLPQPNSFLSKSHISVPFSDNQYCLNSTIHSTLAPSGSSGIYDVDLIDTTWRHTIPGLWTLLIAQFYITQV
jgi:hypothetical protein